LTWETLAPILVAEVLSESDPFKDLIRNVGLYLGVPSIQEYWILDGQDDPEKPALIVYRRRGRQWLKPREFDFGSTYTTSLLPGLKLLVDPRR
jgi:Uma2 family endonuclease